MYFKDLFGPENSYYSESTALPELPPPKLSFEFKRDGELRKPDFNRFHTVRCHIKLTKSTKLNITGEYSLIPNNPFLVQVNQVVFRQVCEDLQDLRPKVKKFKKYLQQSKRTMFITEIPKLRVDMINKYGLDITLQRGQDPFVFKPDFELNSVNVLALFKSQKSAGIFIEELDQTFIQRSIQIASLGNVELKSAYPYHDINFESFEFGKEIDSDDLRDETKSIQKFFNSQFIDCAYADFESSDTHHANWLHFTIIMIQNLQEGGCFIFRMKYLENQRILYYIYLFSQIFGSVIIEKELSDHTILQSRQYVGCYDFNRTRGLEYLDDLIRSFFYIQSNQDLGLFDYKCMLRDNEFQKEMNHFYSHLHKYREQQLKLIKWIDAQLITKSIEEVASEVKADILRPKEIIEKRNDRSNNSTRPRYDGQSQREDRQQSQGRTFSNGNYKNQTKTLNPIMQVHEYKPLQVDDSPKIRRPRQAPVQTIDPKEQDRLRKEKEAQQLEELISKSGQKQKPKQHNKKEVKQNKRGEKITQFSR